MRKVILQMMVSVDGFFEGPHQEIDWHVVDAEFNELAAEFLDSVDTILFGRTTYEMMAAYWPTPSAMKDDPMIAGKMNAMRKIVFSRTLEKADWNNTTLVKGDAAEDVARLKKMPGKDIAIFGSSKLAVSLSERGLIDEYRIMVNPVALGSGHSLFGGMKGRLKLRL
jgi:dihydrofolate reductase